MATFQTAALIVNWQKREVMAIDLWLGTTAYSTVNVGRKTRTLFIKYLVVWIFCQIKCKPGSVL